MPKWTVYVPYTATYIVRDVEAADKDQAIGAVQTSPTLCHHCSRELDLSPDANWDEAEAEKDDS